MEIMKKIRVFSLKQNTPKEEKQTERFNTFQFRLKRIQMQSSVLLLFFD